VVTLLLEMGAELVFKAEYGRTSLSRAPSLSMVAENGHGAAMKLLLDKETQKSIMPWCSSSIV
jgi:hypothetical protein